LAGFAVQPAVSAQRPVRPDQSCVPFASHSGYVGSTFSQSFHPKAASVAAVDVLLASVTAQRFAPLVRLVGQRDLTEGFAVQTVVFARQQKTVTFPAFQPTWIRLRLPKPLALSSVGPTVNQLAVEVELPAGDDSIFWLICDDYLGGTGQVDVDPGSVVDRDTGTAIVQNQQHGLAFRDYSTNP
jgi:hypothetical protein